MLPQKMPEKNPCLKSKAGIYWEADEVNINMI